jgi:hypothetical protein
VDLHRIVVESGGLGADGGGELDVFGFGEVGSSGGDGDGAAEDN